jgi:Na+/alanine symporter
VTGSAGVVTMLGWLFFLFPRDCQAQVVVVQLLGNCIPLSHIHAIAQSAQLTTLPAATVRQIIDTAFQRERIFWLLNLVLFLLSSGVFLVALVAGTVLPAFIYLFIMLACFIDSEQFVIKVPDMYSRVFADALSRRDIL